MNRSRSILRKLGEKLLLFVFMLLLLSVVVFFAARFTPGDPLQSFFGDAMESMSPAELQTAREQLGLTGPIWLQYCRWIAKVAKGDFGLSLRYKRPVSEVVKPLIGNTLILGSSAYIMVFILAAGLSLICVRYEDRLPDQIIRKLGTIVFYVPAFWLGVVLVLIFSVNLRWLPSSGAYGLGKAADVGDRISHLVMPLAVMVLSHVWYYGYMIRNKLSDEARRDYVLLARAKGLGRTEILVKHCFRNVLPTIVSIMAISIPHVLSGTYIAEAVFNYPGIGLLAGNSAKYHDYNLLMVMVLLTGALVISAGMAAQFVSEIIDPRMRELDEGWLKITDS